MNKEDLALNNRQWFICHKIQPTKLNNKKWLREYKVTLKALFHANHKS